MFSRRPKNDHGGSVDFENIRLMLGDSHRPTLGQLVYHLVNVLLVLDCAVVWLVRLCRLGIIAFGAMVVVVVVVFVVCIIYFIVECWPIAYYLRRTHSWQVYKKNVVILNTENIIRYLISSKIKKGFTTRKTKDKLAVTWLLLLLTLLSLLCCVHLASIKLGDVSSWSWNMKQNENKLRNNLNYFRTTDVTVSGNKTHTYVSLILVDLLKCINSQWRLGKVKPVLDFGSWTQRHFGTSPESCAAFVHSIYYIVYVRMNNKANRIKRVGFSFSFLFYFCYYDCNMSGAAIYRNKSSYY